MMDPSVPNVFDQAVQTQAAPAVKRTSRRAPTLPRRREGSDAIAPALTGALVYEGTCFRVGTQRYRACVTKNFSLPNWFWVNTRTGDATGAVVVSSIP
jgi:hypothetical protein